MKIAEYTRSYVDRLPKGYVFTYLEISKEVEQKDAVIKTLNRMVSSGKLTKLSKGRFYKPENTPFGTLLPKQEQIVKDLLEEQGKVTGYLTGYSIYNNLGLTTQVSNTIQIGKQDIRPSLKREQYTITFVRQKNTITKENIPLLQILDAIRYIKKIPDADTKNLCIRFLAILKPFSENDINRLVRLALKYPPSTRSLLGALLDELDKTVLADPLYKSLNPITTYSLSGASKVLSSCAKWHLV